MQIISTVDPNTWTPSQMTCSKCGTIFRAHLDEFEKSFKYPSEYDRIPGSIWIPYKFNWLGIKCPTCKTFITVSNIPSPVVDMWLSEKRAYIEADMKTHPENYRYY